MNKLASYFHPTSLTWWAGVIAILIGGAEALGFAHPSLGVFGQVLAALTGGGDASPVGLITLGAGLVGIRAKLSRIAAQGVNP